MKALLLAAASSLVLSTAQAGNTSSNSSSNSSNGVHTRVDTIITDDGNGRRSYRRSYLRERSDGSSRARRWRDRDDDD